MSWTNANCFGRVATRRRLRTIWARWGGKLAWLFLLTIPSISLSPCLLRTVLATSKSPIKKIPRSSGSLSFTTCNGCCSLLLIPKLLKGRDLWANLWFVSFFFFVIDCCIQYIFWILTFDAIGCNFFQAHDLEQFDQEITLSIQSIGLSLVNNDNRQEISYISISKWVPSLPAKQLVSGKKPYRSWLFSSSRITSCARSLQLFAFCFVDYACLGRKGRTGLSESRQMREFFHQLAEVPQYSAVEGTTFW